MLVIMTCNHIASCDDHNGDCDGYDDVHDHDLGGDDYDDDGE